MKSFRVEKRSKVDFEPFHDLQSFYVQKTTQKFFSSSYKENIFETLKRKIAV